MKKGIAIILMLIAGFGLFACDSVISTTVTTTASITTIPDSTSATTMDAPLVMEFDFDLPSDVSTSSLSLTDFIIISGHNLTSADYEVDLERGVLTFKKEYLAYLNPGIYTYTLHRSDTEEKFNLNIIDRNQQYRLVNESFETGDLFGWEPQIIFKGESNLFAFDDGVVVENGMIPGSEIAYGAEGEYLVGIDSGIALSLFEERMGKLRSTTFILGGSGYITFRLGGGGNPALGYLSVRNSMDDTEVARFYPEIAATHPAELILYKADLSEAIGERLYLELIDLYGHEGDYLTFDDFQVYHQSIPEEGMLATSILPTFAVAYVPNQLPNGNFENGLEGWTEVYGEAFRVENNTLKSNQGGDEAVGVIRSSLFRVDGSGIASVTISAARGARYDKDTFISVKEASTNREILRFANRNHDGIFPVTYYLDLGEYLGKNLYFEIVDNAKGSYDTIFVSDIVTYYQERPDFTYKDLALNLNE